MRILITSDNHLGYKEADPILGKDSFLTFKEILKLATEGDVDLVLQGGDLFNDNRPSRNTYNTTIQLFSEHCLGNKLCTLRTVPNTGGMNWEKESMKISMPILSIHGNHDDPSGLGSISPHDILSSAGLLNYFGKAKFNEEGNAVLKPILLEKVEDDGSVTKVAIYGFGYINNRHAFRLFSKGKIEYVRPGSEGWYNILVVHQNRVPRESDYLPTEAIPSFFDLVVYGHEHESMHICHKNFDILQPGSTVRTSLCEGENYDKYVYIAEISSSSSSIQRLKLGTVRPLLMDSIKVEKNPSEIINRKLNEMIREATANNLEGYITLPLIRLRVNLVDCHFSEKHLILAFLKDKVANPEDAIKICKQREVKTNKKGEVHAINNIFDVYSSILKENSFNVIQHPIIISALKDYLHKGEKGAFERAIRRSVQCIVDFINPDGIITDNIVDTIKSAYKALSEGRESETKVLENKESDEVSSLGENTSSEQVSKVYSESLSEVLSLQLDKKSDNSIESPGASSEVSNQKDYTFLEHKRELEENAELIKRLKAEKNYLKSWRATLKKHCFLLINICSLLAKRLPEYLSFYLYQYANSSVTTTKIM